MHKWQRLDDGTQILKAGYRTVTEKTFRKNDGTVVHASIDGKDGAEAAGVVALTPDGKVLVARQFRCGPEEVMDEIPGGIVDPGETHEQAARRELAEEVGYEPGTFEYLGKTYVNAWDSLVRHYYFATNCRPIASINPDEMEEIEVATITVDQLIDNARHARMTDIQAVFLAYDKLKQQEG